MHVSAESDFFSNSICNAVRRREYSKLEPMMRAVLIREDKLVLLSHLCDLPSQCFTAFFLCGLACLNAMDVDEYRKLYELSKGHDIKIYQLTRFLIIHGGAKKQALRRLCADYGEIQKIDQFAFFLEEGNELPPNEKKMNALLYRDYAVPNESIAIFVGKFSSTAQ